MLNKFEKHYIYQHAYLPEHLVDYVNAINKAQPHLVDNHLCFMRKRHLLFVGYPLNRAMPWDVHNTFQKAVSTFRPASATLLAETIGHPDGAIATDLDDDYYFLQFPPPATPARLAYMTRRARKEMHISTSDFGASHQKLIDDFCAEKELSRQQQLTYQRISHYCRTSPTVTLLQATRKDRLIAFSIIDYGSAQHAFYQFHIRSSKRHVPGASDLLFDEMLYQAQALGKTGINLGLGTLPGIRRFKEKWGGRPFFVHRAVHLRYTPSMIDKLMDVLKYSYPAQWD